MARHIHLYADKEKLLTILLILFSFLLAIRYGKYTNNISGSKQENAKLCVIVSTSHGGPLLKVLQELGLKFKFQNLDFVLHFVFL